MFVFTQKEALCSLSKWGLKSWLMLSDSLPGLSCRAMKGAPGFSAVLAVTLGFIRREAQRLFHFVWIYKSIKWIQRPRAVLLRVRLKTPRCWFKETFGDRFNCGGASTCGLHYEDLLTSGRAFSGFRVHSCPELVSVFQTGPLLQLRPLNGLFPQLHT